MAEFSIGSQPLASASALCRLSGDIGAGEFDAIEEEFNRLVESGVQALVLDMSGLESISSAALGAVINLSRLLRERKGALILAALRPKVLGQLEMLGIESGLRLADTLEQAKKAVATPS